MKTIIAGSRTIDDYKIVVKAIKNSGIKITKIISGGAMGVDSLGEKWGKRNKIPIVNFEPDWKTYGNSAGMIRNFQMAKNAEALIAIWDGESPGTKHMIKEAKRNGLKIYIYKIEPEWKKVRELSS